MKFPFKIENFITKKGVSFKNSLIMNSFAILAVLASASALHEQAIVTFCIICLVTFFVFLYYREFKKLYRANTTLEFQRKIAINGYDCSLCAFFIFSNDRKCVFLNKIGENLFTGILIRTLDDFIEAFKAFGNVIDTIKLMERYAEQNRNYHADIPIKTNNQIIWWRVAVAPLNGFRNFSVWSIFDLTLSIRHNDLLDYNASFLLDVVNNSKLGYFSVDKKNNIVFCNKVLASWLGYNINYILSQPYETLINTSKSNKINNNYGTKAVTANLPSKVFFKTNTSDEIETIVKQITTAKDVEITTYIVSKEDVKDDELINALGMTRMYFENIFEDAPMGIVITEGAEIISACNRTFREILNIDEIKSDTSFLDYVHQTDKEKVKERLYNLISSIDSSTKPFEINLNNAKNTSVMIYATRAIDKNNKNSHFSNGLVLYFIDVTDRKELQHQFVQSQKMQAIGQLAGGIAHDFNNLLTAMIGYSDLLLAKHSSSDKSFTDIMQIKQNANRASNLVKQLLAFSRQQTLQPKILNITDILSELSALLKRLIGPKVEFKVVHGRDLSLIKVDQVQFEQVIVNLAVNARDAMQNGGILTITTENFETKQNVTFKAETMPAGKYVLIKIIDTGVGIPQDLLNRIFEPFFSTKEKGSGTGLGLSTVYGIVNQTGGFVNVESKENVGTTFALYFPASEVKENEIKEVKKDKKNIDLTGTGTILLVEDEEAVRMFSARALRDKGYEVIEADCGEEAIKIIRKNKKINLLITDVVMPKMDGPTVMKKVKEEIKGIKVILISGYTEDKLTDGLTNNVDVFFLLKPFNLKELATKVKEVLGT